jgi:hypothetical protein
MDIVQAIMFMMPMAKYHFDGDTIPADGWTYEDLVWDDLFFPKPSKEQLQEAYNLSVATYSNPEGDYRNLRKEHYPTAEQQLAIIYDIGIEGWKEYIKNVKQTIKKPEVN